MAKRNAGGINKSQEIKKYLAEHPGAKPKEIKEALTAQGVDVSAGLISVVKYGKKSGQGAGKPAETRKPRAASAGSSARNGSANSGTHGSHKNGLSADDLIAAKKLVVHLGGLARTHQALETLGQLM